MSEIDSRVNVVFVSKQNSIFFYFFVFHFYFIVYCVCIMVPHDARRTSEEGLDILNLLEYEEGLSNTKKRHHSSSDSDNFTLPSGC